MSHPSRSAPATARRQRGLALRRVGFLLVGTLGCGGSRPSAQLCLVAEPAEGPPLTIRASDEHALTNPECTTDADCAARPHATEVVCHHDRSCMPICERHWADCNSDPTDGCETATSHPLYCEGDLRIEAARQPVIAFAPSGEAKGPGTFSAAAFSHTLARWKPDLERCYRAVLEHTPGVGGLVSYEITIGTAGCLSARFAKSTTASEKLDSCVADFIKRVRISSAPEGGEVTRQWDVVLYAGETQEASEAP